MNSSFNKQRKFFFIPLMIIAFLALGGWAVMLLWNAILPGLIAGIGLLSYPKAVGLLVLCRLLFGGFKGGQRSMHRGPAWREKMQQMSEEERTKFKAEWMERCKRK